MEEWIKLFSGISSENPEIQQQSCSQLEAMMSEMNESMLNATTTVLMDSQVPYNIRHAAGIILGRTFNAYSRPSFKANQDWWKSESNQETTNKIKETILEIIKQDDNLLQNDCLFILALVFQMEQNSLLPILNSFAQSIETIQHITIYIKLMSHVFNLHFYQTTIFKITDFKSFVLHVVSVICYILKESTENLDDTQLRIDAADLILQIIKVEPKTIDSEETVLAILQALPSSFPIPNIDLFKRLTQICSDIATTFYDHCEQFIDTIWEYSNNGFSCEGEDYIISSLEIWLVITKYELSKTKINFRNDQKILFVSLRYFDQLIPILVNFLSQGYYDCRSQVYFTAFNVLQSMFGLSLSLSDNRADLFDQNMRILMQIHNSINENIEPIDLFVDVHIIAAIACPTDLNTRIIALGNFVVETLMFAKINDIFKTHPEPLLKQAAAWALSRILTNMDIRCAQKDFNIGEYMTEILEAIENNFEEATMSGRSFMADLFYALTRAFSTERSHYDLIKDKFFDLYRRYNIEYVNSNVSLNAINKMSNAINNLLYLLTHAVKSTMTKLVEFLNEAFQQTDEKVVYVQKNLLHNIKVNLQRAQYKDFRRQNEGVVYAVEWIPDVETLLRHGLTQHDAITFTDAIVAYAFFVYKTDYHDEAVAEIFKFIFDGISSNDANVIQHCSIAVSVLFNNLNINRLPAIYPFITQCLQCFYDALGSVNPDLAHPSICHAIRAVSDIILCMYNIDVREQNPDLEHIYMQAQGMFNEIICNFLPVDIIKGDKDNERYMQIHVSTLFNAMAVFLVVYLKDRRTDQKNYIRHVVHPYAKSLTDLEKLSMNTMEEVYSAVKKMNNALFKEFRPYLAHTQLVALYNKADDYFGILKKKEELFALLGIQNEYIETNRKNTTRD